MKLAYLATLAVLLPALPVRADDAAPAPAPAPANPGTTLRPGSGGDLKGTTTSGTTLRAGSGSDLKGTTQRGTTMTGTTTRAGSGVAAGMTVGTSTPGSPDAAHARAGAAAAGHGSNRWWNESYYGGPVVARSAVRAVVPVVVETAATPAAPAGTGTVRVIDHGFAAPRVGPTPATPTGYAEPATSPAPMPVVEASRTWNAQPVFRGARFERGSFGGLGTYSGYETWGPTPGPVGVAAGCDCR